MEYRELGGTGRKVSAIGLGCEHLDGKPYAQVKETIDAAIEHGVNILDVFMPGAEVRANIAKAIGSRRGGVMIQGHIGSTDIGKQYAISRDMPTVRRYFEDMLRIFGGYIDFGMMFFIDSENDYKNVFETDFVNYVQRLKRQGDIGHIGFSSHNPETAIRAINTGVPELVLFSVNPAFDMLPAEENVIDHLDKGIVSKLFHGLDPKRAELYKVCSQKQVGITVMKTLGGGKLISPEHTPFDRPMTVPQCVHYALSRPAAASVLLGCRTAEEMSCAMRYFSLGEEERDYTGILSSARHDFMGSCVYCGHCQPCPAGIDIAAVNKYLDIARLNAADIPPSISAHYRALSRTGSECAGCGECEERCPFEVPIRRNMEEAQKLFGGR